MKYLSEIIGKKVYDVNNSMMGVAEDFEISLSEDKVFLRVKGDRLKDIRGRKLEFLPIREIDYVKDGVYLYKTMQDLKEIVEKIYISTAPSYNCGDLIGRYVTSNDEKIGRVADFGIDTPANEVVMLVEGQKIEEIRGEKREKIPVIEIIQITNNIRLQYDFDTLSKRIKEKRK